MTKDKKISSSSHFSYFRFNFVNHLPIKTYVFKIDQKMFLKVRYTVLLNDTTLTHQKLLHNSRNDPLNYIVHQVEIKGYINSH